jgi:hypothetical protein
LSPIINKEGIMTIIRRGREYVDEEEYQDERSEYMRPEYYENDEDKEGEE